MSQFAFVVAPAPVGATAPADCAPTYPVQVALHPGSFPPAVFTSPAPPFRCVCLPAPALGRQPPTHASTNFRNRPTVTSYLSRRKSLIVAGFAVPVPRLNVPPVTARLRAHTSLPLGPQLFRPSPVRLAVVALSSPALATQTFDPPHDCPLPHAPQLATVRALPQLSVPLFVPHVAPRRVQNAASVSPVHPAHTLPLHPKLHEVCAPATHAPPLHVLAAVATPFAQLAPAHAVSVCAYVHWAVPLAPEHVPGPLNVRRVVPFAQVAPGGVLHVTAAHGSPAHTLPLHPKLHEVCAPDTHAPPLHVLAALATPFVQLAGVQGIVVGA